MRFEMFDNGDKLVPQPFLFPRSSLPAKQIYSFAQQTEIGHKENDPLKLILAGPGRSVATRQLIDNRSTWKITVGAFRFHAMRRYCYTGGVQNIFEETCHDDSNHSAQRDRRRDLTTSRGVECSGRGILRGSIKVRMPSGQIRTILDDPNVEVYEQLPDGNWRMLRALKHAAS